MRYNDTMNIPNPKNLVFQSFGAEMIEFVWYEKPHWTVLQSHKDGTRTILMGDGENFEGVDLRKEALGYSTPEISALHDEAVAYLKSL